MLNLFQHLIITMKQYYIYILTNFKNKILYIGITNDLIRRVYEHKQKIVKGFSAKYNLKKLVYYERTESVNEAIKREKQLKNWHRQWKINLISEANPEWNDLSKGWYKTDPETSTMP